MQTYVDNESIESIFMQGCIVVALLIVCKQELFRGNRHGH